MPNPDHKVEGKVNYVECAEWAMTNGTDQGYLLSGLIASNLAIASELQGIREALETVVDAPSGTFDGALKVRVDG